MIEIEPGQEQKDFIEREYSANRYFDVTKHECRIAKVHRWLRELPTGLNILDVGCADGGILRSFVGSHTIYGLDFSESFVRQANRNGIHAKTANLETDVFPFPDALFDVVFTGETIEHLCSTDRFLSEINRVLKSGGTLIMTVPNVRTLISLGMMLVDLPPQYSARYRSPHFRDFTLRTLTMALKENGFVVEMAVGAAFFLPWIGEFWPAIAEHFPSWSHQMVIRAKKTKTVIYDVQKSVQVSLY